MSAELPKIPEPVAFYETEGDEWHIYPRGTSTYEHIRDHQKARIGVHVFALYTAAQLQEAARQAMERFDQFKRIANISEIALHEQNNDLMRQIVGLRSALDIAQRYVALQKAPWSPTVQAEDLQTVNRALPQAEKRHG